MPRSPFLFMSKQQESKAQCPKSPLVQCRGEPLTVSQTQSSLPKGLMISWFLFIPVQKYFVQSAPQCTRQPRAPFSRTERFIKKFSTKVNQQPKPINSLFSPLPGMPTGFTLKGSRGQQAK